jgi:hypothetical protein
MAFDAIDAHTRWRGTQSSNERRWRSPRLQEPSLAASSVWTKGAAQSLHFDPSNPNTLNFATRDVVSGAVVELGCLG